MMNEYYVYAHVDKENQVPFYIGMGKGKRANSKDRHNHWTAFVDKYAREYEVHYIARDISQDLAYEIEYLFITKLGKIRYGNGVLVNWTDGGYGEGVLLTFFKHDSYEITKVLTEYGQQLYLSEFIGSSINNRIEFLGDLMYEASDMARKRIITGISKKVSFNSPWQVPFCLTQKLPKNNDVEIKLKATNLIELYEKINQPIVLDNLPQSSYLYSYPDRITTYYDLILQENVTLEINDTLISKAVSDWYFYADYRNGYLKVIQGLNNGLKLNVRYLGRNTKNHNRKDIHDFEIEVS
jgi:hypothetical protein